MTDPARTRARYRSEGSYVADSLSVRPSQLAVRSFNFGQHWRTSRIENVGYVVELPGQFLLDFLTVEMPEFVDDAGRTSDDDDRFENALRVKGWPDPQAICDDSQLALMALEWWAHDLLLGWFGDGEPKDSPGFVMNTVDSVDFVGSDPRIQGSARAAGIAVRYQDV